MNINNILAAANNTLNQNVNPSNKSLPVVDSDFKELLNNFVSEANNNGFENNATNLSLMLGEAINSHDVMIAGEKADLSLRLTIQIRNKIIDAYSEVMRMQI